MKKHILFLTAMLVLPLALCAQQSVKIDNLLQANADKKGGAYVEMSKVMLKSILCRQSNSNASGGTDKPCSSPDVFKSLTLPADDECMKAFKDAAVSEKFRVLKRSVDDTSETTYYVKEADKNQAEVLILMFTDYVGISSDGRGGGKVTWTPSKISIVYMAGAIDVEKTDGYLSRILEGLRVEAHMNDVRKPLLFADGREPSVLLDGLGVDELNRLIANYQQAVARLTQGVMRSLNNQDRDRQTNMRLVLYREIARFQTESKRLENPSATSPTLRNSSPTGTSIRNSSPTGASKRVVLSPDSTLHLY